jgi:hypothetical protein
LAAVSVFGTDKPNYLAADSYYLAAELIYLAAEIELLGGRTYWEGISWVV